MGPVTDSLRRMFDDIVHGTNPGYIYWNVAV
jgi:hypothetical protein